METITFMREIPIKKQADVFIAGGGPAGIAAAVTAARMGAQAVSYTHLSGWASTICFSTSRYSSSDVISGQPSSL